MKTIHVDAYLADLKKEIERAEREVKPSLLSSPYKEKVGVYIGLSEVYRKAIRQGAPILPICLTWYLYMKMIAALLAL